MNRPRAHAYARVMRILEDCGPAKLLAAEQERIRHAADALLFCADVVRDFEARAAVSDVQDLYDHLVGSGRWTPTRAGELTDAIWECGPGLAPAPLVLAA